MISWLGVTTAGETVLKGPGTRKAENQQVRRNWENKNS